MSVSSIPANVRVAKPLGWLPRTVVVGSLLHIGVLTGVAAHSRLKPFSPVEDRFRQCAMLAGKRLGLQATETRRMIRLHAPDAPGVRVAILPEGGLEIVPEPTLAGIRNGEAERLDAAANEAGKAKFVVESCNANDGLASPARPPVNGRRRAYDSGLNPG